MNLSIVCSKYIMSPLQSKKTLRFPFIGICYHQIHQIPRKIIRDVANELQKTTEIGYKTPMPLILFSSLHRHNIKAFSYKSSSARIKRLLDKTNADFSQKFDKVSPYVKPMNDTEINYIYNHFVVNSTIIENIARNTVERRIGSPQFTRNDEKRIEYVKDYIDEDLESIVNGFLYGNQHYNECVHFTSSTKEFSNTIDFLTQVEDIIRINHQIILLDA